MLECLKEIEILKSRRSSDDQLNKQIEELHARVLSLEYENNLLRASPGHRGSAYKGSNNEDMRLDEKISLLVNENERINRLLFEKSKTLEKAGADMSKNQRESRVLMEDYEEKLMKLNAENLRLAKLSEDWKRALEESNERNYELNESLKEFEDYKQKLRVIVEENDRLNQLLNEKTREIKELKRLCNDRTDLEQQMIRGKRENQRLSDLLDDAMKNLEQSKNVINSLERVQYDNKDLREEVQRVAALLERKTHECEELRGNCLELSHRIEELERKNQNLTKQAEEKAKRLVEVQFQAESLQKQILQENATVSQALVNKDNELVQMKLRCSELEHTIDRLNEERDEINKLLNQSNPRWLVSPIPEKSYESPTKFGRKFASSIKDSVAKVLNEVEQLAMQSAEDKKELDRYQREAGKVLELTATVDALQDENEKLTKKLADKSYEYEQVHAKLLAYQENASKVPYLENELQSAYRNKEIIADKFTTTQAEYDNLLHKHRELELQKQSVERELALQRNRADTIERTLEGIRKENTRLLQKVKELEGSLGVPEALQKEIERKQNLVKEKQAEHEAALNQIRNLENDIQQLVSENEELHQLLNEKTAALQELDERVNLLDQAASRSEPLFELVSKLQSENHKLTAITEQKDKEIENLKVNAALIPELQSKINQLAALNTSLNKNISNLEIEAERCKDLEDTIRRLQSQMRNLQDENSMLDKQLNQVIDRESQEFKTMISSTKLKKGNLSTSPNRSRYDENRGREVTRRLDSDNYDIQTPVKTQTEAEMSRRDQSIADLNMRLSQLETHAQRVPELENRISTLLREKELLEARLREKERELVRVKGVLKEIEIAIKDGGDLKKQLEVIQREDYSLDSSTMSNSRVRELERNLKQMRQEHEKMQQILEERTQELNLLNNLLNTSKQSMNSEINIRPFDLGHERVNCYYYCSRCNVKLG